VRRTRSLKVTATIKAFSNIEGSFGQLDVLHKVHKARVRIVVATDDLRMSIPIEATEIRIGRTEDNDLAIEHPSISSKHATITYRPQDDGFFLLDHHSTNFTFVNGHQIQPGLEIALEPHTAVTFGAVPCLFNHLPDAFPNRPFKVFAPDERLAAILVESNVITKDQAQEAVTEARDKQTPLGEVAVEKGLITPEAWAQVYRGVKSGGGETASPGKKGKGRLIAAVVVVLVVVAAAVAAFLLKG
jgi:pSer/pThr/pTyr-binding forkhead associated (FHA) protein